MKHYSVKILSAVFFMGSFGVGFLAGAEYGKWMGWTVFIIMAVFGILLHKAADKIENSR